MRFVYIIEQVNFRIQERGKSEWMKWTDFSGSRIFPQKAKGWERGYGTG